MKDEIKACPFCGEALEILNSTHSPKGMLRVSHPRNKCVLQLIQHINIKAWNRREEKGGISMFIAHYAADNQYEEFDTFEEAEKWLREMWEDDSGDDGYSEETINGRDFIAKVTHASKFVERGNKEKDGYVWSEEECASINKDGEMWPVSDSFDFYGDIILVKAP